MRPAAPSFVSSRFLRFRLLGRTRDPVGDHIAMAVAPSAKKRWQRHSPVTTAAFAWASQLSRGEGAPPPTAATAFAISRRYHAGKGYRAASTCDLETIRREIELMGDIGAVDEEIGASSP